MVAGCEWQPRRQGLAEECCALPHSWAGIPDRGRLAQPGAELATWAQLEMYLGQYSELMTEQTTNLCWRSSRYQAVLKNSQG